MLATLDPRKPAWALARGRVRLRLCVRPNAFGNALGESFKDAMRPGGAYAAGDYTNEMDRASDNYNPAYAGDYVNEMDRASDNAYYDRVIAQSLSGPSSGLTDTSTDAEVMAYRMREAGFNGDMMPTSGDGSRLKLSNGGGKDYLDQQLRDAKGILNMLDRRDAARATANATPAAGLMVDPSTGLASFSYTSRMLQQSNDGLSSNERELTGNDSGLDLGTRFVKGAAHGALDMVYQPLAQVVDLGQALYGLTTGGAYEPRWFSGIGQNYAGGMGYGETITRAVLGSNPVTGVGMTSYDLTSSAVQSDWGGVAEGLGGLAGGFGAAKFGQSYFRPEPGPGAQLGIYRVRPQVEITDPLVSPGGLLGPLPSWESPNFSTAEPVHIGGKPIYRVSDGVFGDRTKAQVNGGYWADEPAPSTEGAWRSKYAVLNEWTNRGGTEASWTPNGSWAWGGKVAPQAVTGAYREFNVFGSTYRAGWIQAGGGYQIWVPNSYKIITPSMVTLSPTPWNN